MPGPAPGPGSNPEGDQGLATPSGATSPPPDVSLGRASSRWGWPEPPPSLASSSDRLLDGHGPDPSVLNVGGVGNDIALPGDQGREAVGHSAVRANARSAEEVCRLRVRLRRLAHLLEQVRRRLTRFQSGNDQVLRLVGAVAQDQFKGARAEERKPEGRVAEANRLPPPATLWVLSESEPMTRKLAIIPSWA